MVLPVTGWHVRSAIGLLSARLSLAGIDTDQDHVEKKSAQRISELIGFVSAASPFYRDYYRDFLGSGPVALCELPVMKKEAMMDNLDRVFTDRRLTYREIVRHVTSERPGAPFFNEYRIITTSGSTSRRGFFAYNMSEWNVLIAGFWRWMAMAGMAPSLGRRRKIAIVGSPGPAHILNRVSAGVNVGVYQMLYSNTAQPISSVVAQLSAFRPDFLVSYPSLCAILAAEQLDGSLDIRPSVVATGGEVRTADMTERILAAWGVRPLDSYSMTETGLIAGECPEQGAMHMFNDNILLEAVDKENKRVPPGTSGAKVLITNLFLRTQPVIRYEVSDMVTVSDSRCACGRSWPLIQSISGRTNDMLWFRDAANKETIVHPSQLQHLIASTNGVSSYQIVQEADIVRVLVVIDKSPDGATAAVAELRKRLLQRLELLNVRCADVHVAAVDAIARELGPGGKAKLVISDRHRGYLRRRTGCRLAYRRG
jgi:phenylacetate-CoA ligase